MVKQVLMMLLGTCTCATAVISTNHLQTVVVYNSLTGCVCPQQGDMQEETTTMNGEKVRMKLLRICAYATVVINTIHLLPVFIQGRSDMQGETTAVNENVRIKLLRICIIPLHSVFVQDRVTCKEKQQQ